MTDPAERTAGELRQLRQDVWDALGILGFDHDGDKTPDHLVYPSLGTVLKEYAREVREGWDEALDLMPSAADLAIAARVRANSFTDAGPPEYRLGHNRLLERLLNGDTP